MADITITRTEAERLYDLFKNVETADAHYQRCQSDHFRLHVQSVYKNAGITAAFESLKAKLDEAEKADAPETRKNARKSVLT